MSGVYWSITAMSLVTFPEAVAKHMGMDRIVDWIFECYDRESGGFGGNIGHDAHLLYTLSAIQILAIFDKVSESWEG